LVVPVGLTNHRMNLASLRLMNPEEAHSSLNLIRSLQNQMLESHGHRWVFPADELLQLGGVPFPADDEYEDYPQLDNGIGLARWTITQAEQAMVNLPAGLAEPRRLLWVTGHSAGKVLNEIAAAFTSRITNLNIDLLPVTNNLLGENVTVAGLLGGRDISGAIQDFLREKPDSSLTKIYLPPSCLNADGLLLDDWTEERIALQVGLPVEAFEGCWETMILGEDPEACK
jgi:NifB/MoaA-like Fe-S oxidoreductase